MYQLYLERYEALNLITNFDSEAASLAVTTEKGELLIEMNKFKKGNPAMFKPSIIRPNTVKVFELEKEIKDMSETVDDIQYDLRRFIMTTIFLNFLILGVVLAAVILLILTK